LSLTAQPHALFISYQPSHAQNEQYFIFSGARSHGIHHCSIQLPRKLLIHFHNISVRYKKKILPALGAQSEAKTSRSIHQCCSPGDVPVTLFKAGHVAHASAAIQQKPRFLSQYFLPSVLRRHQSQVSLAWLARSHPSPPTPLRQHRHPPCKRQLQSVPGHTGQHLHKREEDESCLSESVVG